MTGTGARTGGHGMPPKLRTITFVDRITFDFKGNVAQVRLNQEPVLRSRVATPAL
jgi:hypothetical protein